MNLKSDKFSGISPSPCSSSPRRRPRLDHAPGLHDDQPIQGQVPQRHSCRLHPRSLPWVHKSLHLQKGTRASWDITFISFSKKKMKFALIFWWRNENRCLQITTTVHNIIVGKLWIDNHGEMEITNHGTGHVLRLKFYPYSYFSREPPRKVGYTFICGNCLKLKQFCRDSIIEWAPLDFRHSTRFRGSAAVRRPRHVGFPRRHVQGAQLYGFGWENQSRFGGRGNQDLVHQFATVRVFFCKKTFKFREKFIHFPHIIDRS